MPLTLSEIQTHLDGIAHAYELGDADPSVCPVGDALVASGGATFGASTGTPPSAFGSTVAVLGSGARLTVTAAVRDALDAFDAGMRTWECWIRHRSELSADTNVWNQFDGSFDIFTQRIRFDQSNQGVEFIGGGGAGVYQRQSDANALLSANTDLFHHWAITFEELTGDEKRMIFYIDGVAVGTRTFTPSPTGRSFPGDASYIADTYLEGAAAVMEACGFRVHTRTCTADDIAYSYNEGTGKTIADINADIAAGLVAGPLLAAWGSAGSPGARGGITLSGDAVGDRARLAVATPEVTAIADDPIPGGSVQSMMQVGRRIGWGGADENGVHFTLTDAEGLNPTQYEISTPANNSSNPNGKPTTLGFRDISLGKTWEEVNAAYQGFSGALLAGETEDDPALAIVLAARRNYDNALGDADKTDPINWGRDQLAVLTASVDDFTSEPTWSKAVGWRKSSETRDVAAALNAIGADWSITVNKHPTRPWYAVGIANYLGGDEDAQNGNQKGYAEFAWFLARIDAGVWTVSKVETVMIVNPQASGLAFRHTHGGIIAWDGDVPVALAVASSDNPAIPSSILGRRCTSDALSHFAALDQVGSLVSGGLGSATSWWATDGSSTMAGENWLIYDTDDPDDVYAAENENQGWGPIVPVHGVLGSSSPRIVGHQPVGLGQSGPWIYMGSDEEDATMYRVAVADIGVATPTVEIISDLPRMRGCFAICGLPTGGAVAALTDDPSSGDSDRGVVALERSGVWGTLYNPPAGSRIRSVGNTELICATASNADFVRVRHDGPARVSRGLVAEPARTNLLTNGVLTTLVGTNFSASAVTPAQVSALGVAPIPGAQHYRITWTAGANWQPLRITWDEVASLGAGLIRVAGYNLLGDRRGTGTFFWYATDGVASAPSYATQVGNGMVCGPYGVASGWTVNQIRTAGSSLNTMGGTDVRPVAEFRADGSNPTPGDGDMIVAFSLEALAATEPVPHRVLPEALDAASASCALPALGSSNAVLATVECGRGFEDSIAPSSGLIPIVRFADAATPTKSITISADLAGSPDSLVITEQDDTDTTVTSIGLGGVRWWDGTILRAVLVDGSELFVSWGNRPFELVWTNPGAAWDCRHVEAEPSGVILHDVAAQDGVSLSDAEAVRSWAEGAASRMAGVGNKPSTGRKLLMGVV